MALRKHSNYFPPAGVVEVANDHSWRWDGRRWLHNGRVDVPTNRSLRGVPGSSHNGWFYDWHQYAWMEPVAATPAAPAHRPPAPIAHLPVHPVAHPAPAAPQPQPAVVHHEEHHHHKEEPMTQCQHHHKPASVYEGLKDHWVVPLVGALLVVGADFMQQPQPPVVPAGLPDEIKAQWMMIYNQNLNLYSTRKATLEKYGGVLLALGLGNAATSEATKHDLVGMLRGHTSGHAGGHAEHGHHAAAHHEHHRAA